jgi:hypothetical protein
VGRKISIKNPSVGVTHIVCQSKHIPFLPRSHCAVANPLLLRNHSQRANVVLIRKEKRKHIVVIWGTFFFFRQLKRMTTRLISNTKP